VGRLAAHCQRLRLYRVEAELSTLLEQAAKKDLGYSDFLDEALALELRSKQDNHLAMLICIARFPFSANPGIVCLAAHLLPSVEAGLIEARNSGALWASGGAVVTVVTYFGAAPCSVYLVARGPVV
jgi:hypothetical protein